MDLKSHYTLLFTCTIVLNSTVYYSTGLTDCDKPASSAVVRYRLVSNDCEGEVEPLVNTTDASSHLAEPQLTKAGPPPASASRPARSCRS